MKPVKFDRVKLRAMQEANISLESPDKAACYAMLDGVADGTFDWRKNFGKLQKLVWDRIDKWDIRCLKSLHMLFPACLPKDCKYIVEEGDDGWWIVG